MDAEAKRQNYTMRRQSLHGVGHWILLQQEGLLQHNEMPTRLLCEAWKRSYSMRRHGTKSVQFERGLEHVLLASWPVH
jgi:hypothetical protein